MGYAAVYVLKTTVLSALVSALAWPATLLRLASVVDNRWAVGLDRAWKAGRLLGDTLLSQAQQGRPVTLVGYSLGARVIAYCLHTLAEAGEKGLGLIEDVFLFGAPVVFTPEEWLACRSVVAGKFVNAYSSNDWVLSFLFRASNVAIGAIAGLGPIPTSHGIENVDVSHLIQGHLEYRNKCPQLLRLVGFEVTSCVIDPEEEELSDEDVGDDSDYEDNDQGQYHPQVHEYNHL
jgi:pimeloyl-ACP methyl ester carboxylesterase